MGTDGFIFFECKRSCETKWRMDPSHLKGNCFTLLRNYDFFERIANVRSFIDGIGLAPKGLPCKEKECDPKIVKYIGKNQEIHSVTHFNVQEVLDVMYSGKKMKKQKILQEIGDQVYSDDFEYMINNYWNINFNKYNSQHFKFDDYAIVEYMLGLERFGPRKNNRLWKCEEYDLVKHILTATKNVENNSGKQNQNEYVLLPDIVEGIIQGFMNLNWEARCIIFFTN